LTDEEIDQLTADAATAEEYYNEWLKTHGAKVMRPREVFYHGFITGLRHVREGGK
jgi:hypothetical protein